MSPLACGRGLESTFDRFKGSPKDKQHHVEP
jgi:hypothetical protein